MARICAVDFGFGMSASSSKKPMPQIDAPNQKGSRAQARVVRISLFEKPATEGWLGGLVTMFASLC